MKFLSLVLLIICASIAPAQAWAQTDRPLRAARSDTPPPAAYPPLPNAALPQLLRPSAIEQPLTQYYITQYSSPGGVAFLNAVLERGSLYLPFIREELKKRNLPPELAYLPVVESNFHITAKSRSGAVGLWQFMMNSVSPFDIKVNDLVDERRDFQKSTIGALQKLEDNYRTLGDWELALAAYNCGLGEMNRTIQRTKIRDYWELCKSDALKSETVHYVPKFIAAAYVLSQPRRFGIDNWQRTIEWTSIPLERQVSLDILAAEADTDRDLLGRLNAELLRGISPADGNYRLKVPSARLEMISAVLEREDLKLARYLYHVVRYGDTLWSMSMRYGTPLNLIEEHNPGISSRYLKIGETVIIPAFNDIPPPEMSPLDRRPLTLQFDGTYIVKKGDTLWSLGLKYGVDPEVLAEENGMELNQILREGKTLKVPIIEQ